MNSKKELPEDPPIHDWMDEKERGFRKEAKNKLLKAIRLGLLPIDKVDEGKIKAFSEGQTSATFFIDGTPDPFVFKMTKKGQSIINEVKFINKWKELGINTLEVLQLHQGSSEFPDPFALYKYLDLPLLSEATTIKQRVKRGISREMGITLAKMHQPIGEGYGWAVAGKGFKGEFDSLKEYSEDVLFQDRIPKLIKSGVIGDDYIEVARKALKIMEEDIRADSKTCLNHDDFLPNNIFYNEEKNEIIPFDPNSRLNHPYACLASTLIRSLAEEEDPVAARQEYKEILKGYSSVSKVDEKLLRAAIILRSLRVMPIWHKKGFNKRNTNLIKELEEYRKYL